MTLYHMSDTLNVGDTLVPDYKRNSSLAAPFAKALSISIDAFQGLLLNAEYFGSVLAKYGLAGMPTHETKWAAEGIFEHVRRREFPDCCGRMGSNYFYDSIELCKKLYEEDWGSAPLEERERIRLFEVEVSGRTARYDMQLFDEAFDCLSEGQTAEDIRHCMELARMYYQGGRSASPIIEILCDGTVTAIRELALR